MYKDLNQKLNELRTKTARFRRVALHLHSPDSYDWGRGGKKNLNDRSLFEDDEGLVAFADKLRPHLDFVGVTDHMRCDYATQLSTKVGTNDQFMVLPAMEVNFRPEAALGFARIHLLVILPEDSTKEGFSRLFSSMPKIPDDKKRTGQEEVSGVSLEKWVKHVHEQGGICIAAHVDNDKGVRCCFRQTARETLKLFSDTEGIEQEREFDVGDKLKQYLLKSGVDAVEISKASDTRHYRWVSGMPGKVVWIPTVLTFDAHCVEDFARADRITHIKMTQLGLQGLKDALKFPDTRIRFPENLPTPPSPCLLGIQIHGEDSSFFKDVTIAFAENLNCVIGPRGSGKSTMVEALRYVFGYNRTIGEVGKQLQEAIREMQRRNLDGCLIRVIYRISSGEQRVLSAAFDPKQDYVTRVAMLSGDYLEVADIEASSEYPLRLFGWSEIETLGRSPAKQRDLLDRLVPELGVTLRSREDLRGQLKENRGAVNKAMAEVKAAYEKNDGEIKRFKEFQGDFEKMNTKEVQNSFATLDLAALKRRVLQQVEENIKKVVDRLTDPSQISLQAGLEAIFKGVTPSLRDWWVATEMARLGILGVEQDVQKAMREATERLQSFGALLRDHIGEINKETSTVGKELQQRFADDASMQKIMDLRSNAEKRLLRVSELRKEYEKRWEKLQHVLEERRELANRLGKVQNEIAGIRAKHNQTVEDTLNRFLPEGMRVSIEFRAGGDTEKFGAKLQEIFGARSHQVKRIRAVIQDVTTPVSFVEMVLSNNFGRLLGTKVEVAGETLELSDEDIKACMSFLKPFEYEDHADTNILAEEGNRLETLLDLQETHWDDFESILLNGSPVSEKSPGQRSSAMLPLICLAEKAPLVIDQPEDNLDKKLIGNVLMKVLAELKEKRQIIVCTHDPNILVGGDAEQVIVLDAESDRRGKVLEHGSIDNDYIVDTVIELLEGGADAFQTRQKRYEGRVGA